MVRFKNRYFLIQLLPITKSSAVGVENIVDEGAKQLEFGSPSTIANMVRGAVEENFGMAMASKINPSLSIKFASQETFLVILRCARDAYKPVWSSITFLNVFPGKNANSEVPCIWQVVGISGTIRCSQMRAIRLHRHSLQQLIKSNNLSQEERMQVENVLKDIEGAIRRIEA